ncbi:MAG: hypothetical protein B6242_16625 [Anaerolineaceae bacterium 4572_78]|nr:MAG: hypothetical protein B6242_16625 [Anaerolineaceae bacterium 4572_78]
MSKKVSTKFSPISHGFNFANYFKFELPDIKLPASIKLPKVDAVYGLCGGMSAVACDYFLAGRSAPDVKERPAPDSDLYKYIFKRQMQSYGTKGFIVLKLIEWMARPTNSGTIGGFDIAQIDSTRELTLKSFDKDVKPELDEGKPIPLGIVYVSAVDTFQVWQNHQVLAYGYSEVSDDEFHISIYDPNFPNKDDVIIKAKKISVGKTLMRNTIWGLECTRKGGGQKDKPIRGFFTIPYEPMTPPEDV